MRLWSLHPRYLDARGLVALWREALLAQAVLLGRTRGYTRHPQLERFRAAPDPAGTVARYLAAVEAEARTRGYAFDARRIEAAPWEGKLPVPRGQLAYEWQHLEAKLRRRAPEWLESLGMPKRLRAHPLFRTVPGDVAAWEREK